MTIMNTSDVRKLSEKTRASRKERELAQKAKRHDIAQRLEAAFAISPIEGLRTSQRLLSTGKPVVLRKPAAPQPDGASFVERLAAEMAAALAKFAREGAR